jgi:Zn-dependent protease with chaperone function
MISDRALETLQQQSVSAIVAHELGHFRNWHVAIRLIIVLAGGAVALVAIRWISVSSLGTALATSLTALVPLIMCLYLALMLRWVAPALEHQADAYALRLLVGEQGSPEVRERLAGDLIQAIGELSVMSGVPLESRTWLHPSWQQRRQFLLSAARLEPVEGQLGWWITLQLLLHALLLVSAGWFFWMLG